VRELVAPAEGARSRCTGCCELRIDDVPVSRRQSTLAGTQLGVDTASGAVEAAAAYEGSVVSRCSATVTAPSSHDRGGEPGEASRACSSSRPPHRRHHRRSGWRAKSPAALARRHTRLEHGANPAMRGIRSMSYRAGRWLRRCEWASRNCWRNSGKRFVVRLASLGANLAPTSWWRVSGSSGGERR
jgi:hypothetical protein